MSKTTNTPDNNAMSEATPRRIPAGFIQPPNEYTVEWDSNGEPLHYYRNRLFTDYFDAQIVMNPQTGAESVYLEANLLEAPFEESRIAMGQLLAWFHVAVESGHLDMPEIK